MFITTDHTFQMLLCSTPQTVQHYGGESKHYIWIILFTHQLYTLKKLKNRNEKKFILNCL